MRKSTKKSIIIRSSKVSLKKANTNKKLSLKDFIEEYNRILIIFIDKLWFCQSKDDKIFR